MTIAIYADPLSVFTSFLPQRGLVRQLVKEMQSDNFIFFIHKRYRQNSILKQFFESLKEEKNWEIIELKYPHFLTRLLQLATFSFPRLPVSADVYISPDIETFGRNARPLINFLPDLTVYDSLKHTSLSLFHSLFRRMRIGLMSKRTDCVIVVSKFTADRFFRHFPGRKHLVEVIYNGIESDWFEDFPLSGKEAGRYWMWMGGSFDSRKNLRRLLIAYQILTREAEVKLPEIKLVGLDDHSMRELRILLRELKIEEVVMVIPKVPLRDLIRMMDSSLGLLFPSMYEGFGLPVIEAFARGKPALVSNITSLPEISNNLGAICDPYSIDSIKAGLMSMMELSKNSELCHLRKEWASQFTYQKAAADFKKVMADKYR